MQRAIIALLATAVLLLICAAPVLAQSAPTQPVTATVQVTAYVSATITDSLPQGISFGSRAPGEQDAKDNLNYDVEPCVTITVLKETNTAVDVKLMGTDFTGGSKTIPIGNAAWYLSDDPSSATAMSDSYATVATLQPSASNQVVKIYHWLDIPTVAAAGAYSSTFTYQVAAVQ